VPRRARVWWALGVLWLLMVGYTAYIAALSIRQHDAFITTKADLGHFDQAIWNTLQGRPFVRTQLGQQLTRLTDHVEPVLVPISLVFLVWDDVRALLVLQAVAVALGALPVYWMTRDEVAGRTGGADDGPALGSPALSSPVPELAGLALAAVYLLFPALVAANLTEFHAAPLMVAPMLLALYYARQERFGRMWLWALVVMAVKEEMPLLTLMLGLWLVVFRRRWRHGLVLVAVSAIWFGVATFVIVPHFAALKYGVEESVYFQRYGELGDSPWAVARSLVTRPGLVWQIATQPARLQYLWGLLASAGLILPLLAPEVLLLSLPSLLANVLSGYEAMYSGMFHYSAPVVPFVVAAAVVGLGRLAGRGRRGRVVVLAAVVLVLGGSLTYHRLHGHTHLARGFRWPEVTAHHRLLEQRFAPQVPPGAVLSTTAPLFPHLDHRERIHQFPSVEDATWVLLDAGSFPEMHPADFRRAYDELIASGEWCIVDAADGYILLERRQGADAGCVRELPDAFFDFARVETPEPMYPVAANFGDRVRLLGYDVTSVPQWRRVGVRLYWQALREGAGEVRLSPFWLGGSGQVIETVAQRPLVEPIWYPPSRWRAGEVVVTEMLPWDLGTAFRLGVAVLEGASGTDGPDGRLPVQLSPDRTAPAGEPAMVAMEGGTWLRLPAFAWEAGQVRLVDEGAAPDRVLEAQFGELFALLGFGLAPQAPCPGDELRLRLHWEATAPVGRDLTVFVHLLNGAGERVAQGDGVPGYLGALPTTLWQPGVPVLDEHVVDLPEDLAAGPYALWIGWYDPQTGARLPLGDGTDMLRVAQVQVR
jgi:uncharacterized membrane protein